MRYWKQYLVEEKIDICCATETHMDEEREKLLIDIFEDKFECISKIRKEREERRLREWGASYIDEEE